MIGARAGVPRQYLQSGAGVSQEWQWPDPATLGVTGNAATVTLVSRTGTQRNGSVGGNMKARADVDGRFVGQLDVATSTPSNFILTNLGRINPAWHPRPYLNTPGPCGVIRIMATLKANGAGLADNDLTGDFGIQMSAGNISQMIAGGVNRLGIGIQLSAPTAAQLVTRDAAGALHRATITSDPFTRADTHKYELRIFEADAVNYGRLEVWIDGVQAAIPVAMSTFGPGTQLPAMTAAGAENALGFELQVVNGQPLGNGATLDLSRLIVRYGPTLNDVL